MSGTEPARGAPTVEVRGDDRALAAAVEARPGAAVRFRPDASSDLARAIGVTAAGVRAPVTLDVLRLGPASVAVNVVVLGPAPDRLRRRHRRLRCRVEIDGQVRWEAPATTVVVANGEYVRAGDLVPRGHPGDGRLEVHVYALEPGQRRGLRMRLPTGTHLPHPRILTAGGCQVAVRFDRAVPLEVDGRRRGRAASVEVSLEAAALMLVP